MQIHEILNSLDLSEKKQLYTLLKKDIGLIPQLDKIKTKLNKDQKVLWYCALTVIVQIF